MGRTSVATKIGRDDLELRTKRYRELILLQIGAAGAMQQQDRLASPHDEILNVERPRGTTAAAESLKIRNAPYRRFGINFLTVSINVGGVS